MTYEHSKAVEGNDLWKYQIQSLFGPKKKKKKSQTAKRKILGIKFLLNSLFNFSNSLEISVKFYWRMPIKMPNLKYPILFF
jgi:hypothetical protein